LQDCRIAGLQKVKEKGRKDEEKAEKG